MALKPQNIPVIFSGGLDQKTADQLVVPGKFLVLENCVRRKMGRVEKRHGFTALGTDTINRPHPYIGDPVTSGKKLATRDNELLMFDGSGVYSYIDGSDKLIYRGETVPLDITMSPVIRNSNRQAMPDGDRLGDYLVSAWEDSGGSSRASVHDALTGAALMYDQTVSGTRPKVATIKNRTFIFYYVAGAIRWESISVANPTTFSTSSSATWITSVTDTAFDVHSTGDYAVIAVTKSDGSIFVAYVNEDGDLGTGANGLPNSSSIASGTANTSGCSIYCDTTLGQKYVYVMHLSNASVKVTAFNSLLTVQSTVTTATSDARNVTGIQKSDGSLLHVVWEYTLTGGNGIRGIRLSFDGTTLSAVGGISPIVLGMGLVSKVFEANDNLHVLTAFQSSIQGSYYVLRFDIPTGISQVVGQLAYGVADGYTKDTGSPGSAKTGLCRVYTDINGALQSLVVTSSKVQADGGGNILSVSKGIQRCTLDFNGNISTPIEAGKSLIVPGGIVLEYDGVSTFESGYFTFPEVAAPTNLPTSGGTFPAVGTWYYAAVYEWVDAQGQSHRSAPSVIQSQTITSTADRVQLSIPTYRFTLRSSAYSRSPVKIVLYRNHVENQNAVLYRLTEITNNTAVNSVTYIDDNSAGSNLNLREVLYTTGDVLENIVPPASKVALRHKNRVFLAGLEQSGQVAYSKEIVDGEAVAFSDTLVIQADGSRGGITALGPLDDKVVLFKKDGILGVVGDGPLDTGAQNNFSLPQKVSGDVGTDNQDSILEIPTGLMFQSDKGIYLLDRSLGTAYIGAPVENYNSYRITSAVLVEDSNEARFTTADGPTLVYNYLFDQWSVFINYEAQHAINGLGSYLHLKSDGRIMKEDSGYLDNGSRIQMNIEISWLAVANLQGYQRVIEYEFMGDFVSDHVTRVKISYDYEKYTSQTVYFNAGNALELSTYGDDATYGQTVYGGTGSTVYQFKSKPRRQKCKAIKFRIEELDTITAAGGGSFNLVALTLRVGVKDTLAKNSKAGEI